MRVRTESTGLEDFRETSAYLVTSVLDEERLSSPQVIAI